MKFKVSIALDECEFRALALDDAVNKVRLIRRNFAFGRKGIFNNPKQIPREHEIIFAQLYEKLGYETQAIDKFKKFRADYLRSIKEVWDGYYAKISANTLDFGYWESARGRIRMFNDLVKMIPHCQELIKKYRGKTISDVPYLIKDAFLHIEYGNEYSLAFHLQELGVSWHHFHYPTKSKYAFPIVKEFAKVKVIKQKSKI